MFSAISDGQPEKTTTENYVLLIKVRLTLQKVFFYRHRKINFIISVET